MIFLDDYFESIEYVPIELRQGFTSIRELDLQVHNAMDALDKNFKEFFDKIPTLTSQQKDDRFDSLKVECDEVLSIADDKCRVADSLHELIEKCRRHLDIGLEKLREDLKDGDKADIIEELERRSKEEDDLYQQQQEQMILQQKQLQQQLQQKQQQLALSQTPTSAIPANTNAKGAATTSNNQNHNNYQNKIYSHNQSNSINKTNTTTPRINNTNKQLQSAGNPSASNQKQSLQKKREKKRLSNNNLMNNNMSIFNSNSNINGVTFSQTNLDYLNSLAPGNSQTIKNNHNNKLHNSCHTPPANLNNKHMHPTVSHHNHQPIRTNHNNIPQHYLSDKISNNKNRVNINPSLTPQNHTAHIHNSQILQSPSSSTPVKDKNQSSISRAYQQISLKSAITAVNAVSPTPSFSDKKMISSNPNGDILATSVINMNKISPLTTNPSHTSTTTNTTINNIQLASAAGLVSNAATIAYNQLAQGVLAASSGASTSLNQRKQYSDKNYQLNSCRASGDSFPTPPSINQMQNPPPSSAASHLHCNDPIVAAASQAINATQQMQQGRRTSSLKASYAAVNSGGLQNISGGMLVPSPQQQQQQTQQSQQQLQQHHHHNLQLKDGSPNNNPLSTFNYHPYNQSQQETVNHQAYMMNNTMIHGQTNLENNRVPPLHISLKGPSRAIKKLKQHQELSPNDGGVYHFEDVEGDSSSHSELFGSSMSPRTPRPTTFESMRLPVSLSNMNHHNHLMGDNNQQMMLHNHHQGNAGSLIHNDVSGGGGLSIPSNEVYCYCRKMVLGADMIGCDNPNCPIEWFHYECVGIKTPPEGKWYCDPCKTDL